MKYNEGDVITHFRLIKKDREHGRSDRWHVVCLECGNESTKNLQHMQISTVCVCGVPGKTAERLQHLKDCHSCTTAVEFAQVHGITDSYARMLAARINVSFKPAQKGRSMPKTNPNIPRTEAKLDPCLLVFLS